MRLAYDRVIIGAGFYGLYSAIQCGKQGEKVLVIEKEAEAFMRASYINQARVHMGYHYPRSISTAIKSAKYFDRFCDEFAFCINKDFEQIYATSKRLSWTNSEDFQLFCKNANIPCHINDVNDYFKSEMCDGAFSTQEYTYDAIILKKHLLEEIEQSANITIKYKSKPIRINRIGNEWEICSNDYKFYSPYILNASYAGVNDILLLTEGGIFEPFKIKYEKCEIILCDVNENLKNLGITVMDGPFFSIMPFGKTGFHSLTSVAFTPHETCYNANPTFECQETILESDFEFCHYGDTGNCDRCTNKPNSAWAYMSQLARKYLKDEFEFSYNRSLFSMKPILVDSEVDDSRPTIIRKHCISPTMVSVLSGKINTVYDLDEVLFDG